MATAFVRQFVPGLSNNQHNLAIVETFVNSEKMPGWIWGVSGRSDELANQLELIVRQIISPIDNVGRYIKPLRKVNADEHSERAALLEVYQTVKQNIDAGIIYLGDHIHLNLYTERAPCRYCGGITSDNLTHLGVEGLIADAQKHIESLGVTVSIDVLFTDANRQIMQQGGRVP